MEERRTREVAKIQLQKDVHQKKLIRNLYSIESTMTGVLTLCNCKRIPFYIINYMHVLGCVSTVPTEVEEGITCPGAGGYELPNKITER